MRRNEGVLGGAFASTAFVANLTTVIYYGSSLKIIEQCGHMPHEERPSEVIAAIKQFEITIGSG